MKVDEFLSEVREAMHARRVYADPIEHDGVLVIAAASACARGR